VPARWIRSPWATEGKECFSPTASKTEFVISALAARAKNPDILLLEYPHPRFLQDGFEPILFKIAVAHRLSTTAVNPTPITTTKIFYMYASDCHGAGLGIGGRQQNVRGGIIYFLEFLEQFTYPFRRKSA